MDFSIDLCQLTLLCVGGVCAAYDMISGTSFLRIAGKCGDYVREASEDEHKPRVTVISFLPGSDEDMERWLDAVCCQDYPDYEVICVREASVDIIKECRMKYENRYPGVLITHIQPGALNVSRRKLAFTEGIKAASGDIILTTVPDGRPLSSSWISDITAPLIDGHRMTLGYAYVPFSMMEGMDRWYRQFDNIMAGSRWIASALRGRAYRGDVADMAFRKDLFSTGNGYRNFNFVHSGEDDLFVAQESGPDNIAVQLSDASRIVVEPAKERTLWVQNKDRYDFNSRYLPRTPFMKAGLDSFMRWISFLSLGVAFGLALCPLHILTVVLSVLLILSVCAVEIYSYRMAAKRLDGVRLWWSVPLFMLWRPLGNVLFRMRHADLHKKNFTWRR